MKKRSHLFVTREIIEQVPQNKRKWLLLGSILPDILVHTYIKKHTWKVHLIIQSTGYRSWKKRGRTADILS